MTKKEVQQFLKENGLIVAAGLAAAALIVLTTPGKGRPDVPGLGGRRNAAWRGKGSYGSAPFGSQVSHRSR